MEYGHGREDLSIHQDFAANYGAGEVHRHNGSPKDWFASDKFAAIDQYHHDQQQQQNSAKPVQTLGVDNGEQICNIEKEHMFDKVVTPSDVGKLNRLVIPKQHAEKYFPLDTSSNDQKGLLLNFEDLTGKTWRFRYSYWNSSQSYVMTKGWSRFVKEKKLDAGDIVSFQRGVTDFKHRLFIDWRRRPMITHQLPVDMSHFHNQFYRSTGGILPSWSPFLFRSLPNRVHPGINFQIQNPSNHYYYSGIYGTGNYAGQVMNNNTSVEYLTPPERIGTVQGMGGGGSPRERIPLVFESIPVVQGKKILGSGVAKRLRLFGVNMECPVSSDTSNSDEFEMLSSSVPLSSPTAHDNVNQYDPSCMPGI